MFLYYFKIILHLVKKKKKTSAPVFLIIMWKDNFLSILNLYIKIKYIYLISFLSKWNLEYYITKNKIAKNFLDFSIYVLKNDLILLFGASTIYRKRRKNPQSVIIFLLISILVNSITNN
ncbi:hypothetical protein MHR_0292 [Mesomycoplasma hyorhinis HUB-1]|nr:hypothetical protein MHR_0292 [Mesomycoplasma hyorhinis HUB-1]